MAANRQGGRDRGLRDLLSDPGNQDLDADGSRKDLLDDMGVHDLVHDPGTREARALGSLLAFDLPDEVRLETAGNRSGGFAPRRRSP